MDIEERNRAILKAWEDFLAQDEIDPGVVRKMVADSWRRCKNLGISPYIKKGKIILKGELLLNRIKQKQELIDVALGVMDNLYESVKGSGFVVILCDEEGYLLHVVGDKHVLESASIINFMPGANWSEESIGTNAIGTALATDSPVQLFASEHYCVGCKSWTCSAVPLHDEEGKKIGVLNLSGHYTKVNQHTLGMAVAAANAIENLLRLKKISDNLSVTNNLLNAMMDSMTDGVIATDTAGNITKFNWAVEDILGMTADKIVNKNINAFICDQLDFNNIVHANLFNTDQEVYLRTGRGKIHCTMTFRNIKVNGQVTGVLFILKKMENVKKLVHKIVGARARFTFQDLKGNNQRFQESIEMARRAALGTSTVLLLGESGTGKEMFAQAIHNASRRRQGPFVDLNCGAIPRELIGSELFGYSAGAFTGAKKEGNPGKFELADGGTLFLDEIGDMPLDMQVNLLRVLEEKRVRRIGGQTDILVDVRVIAATNRNLLEMVQNGKFREDLYYRLNVLTIQMIPLRNRKDDLPTLIWFFIEKYNRLMGTEVKRIDGEFLRILSEYDWPGNVRELENVIERAINLALGETLTPDLLPPEITGSFNKTIITEANRNNFCLELAAVEKQLILQVLNECNNNMTQAAKRLGIGRTTLYRRIKEYKDMKL
ncbi:sigma-54-dependent Fis family transcriptional regulator [Thermanaerosceptrum fracticalcis]|uniref:Sigma-54-dependent Fis family transcriptional regulator n=1 Tax=Thermanaerosceptrum fracticalcis TaxID=1712410 RepID=A0A7G6E6U3_THEFR|nr:sigma-54-dependent Fis family transcriptional regulator [Thermanaerosceptrum fracticalcis]QNB47797.1 sigma-54-dependent Fis family transcriptional regulator [Thermanaerosceptrum fracticalcis]